MERRRFLYSALAAASLAAIPAARSSAAATTTARREGSAPMTPSQRQNPMSCNGMVTSPHYLASQAGLDILRRGGTAIDAAVAVAFAMGTVESYYSGLGGGGFMTIRFAETGETTFIDFREVAPAAATPDTWPKDEDGNYVGYYQMIGGPSIAVPGQVKGMLYALEKYGTMSREEVISPAVDLAMNGFEVGAFMNEVLTESYDLYTYTDETAKIYMKDGLPYEVGEIYCNPELGETMQKIIDEGEDGFYSGEVAEAIVNTAQKYGCSITLEDLQNCDFAYAPPFSTAIHPFAVAVNVLLNKLYGKLESFTPAQYAAGEAEGYTMLDVSIQPAFQDVPYIQLNQVNGPLEGHPMDEKLLLVCSTGKRTYLLQNRLKRFGYTNTRILEGGVLFNTQLQGR